MGLDVHLRPKDRDYDYSIEHNQSRRFCNFLCGPEAYPNCEFDQVQSILQIDLSIFKRYPENLEPNIDELNYQIYLAEKENDLKRIKELEQQIEIEKELWNKNYDYVNEGWIKLNELEEVVLAFKEKIIENLDYHKQLEYNYDWGDYFHPHRAIRPQSYKTIGAGLKTSISYTRNILLEDLTSILKWINSAKEKNIEYLTFDYA